MTTNNDDYDIWNSFLKGEEGALDKIYSSYYKSLYEYGMRKFNNEVLVQDAIQDLFVRLWTNRKRLNKTDSIKYYLFSSLKNQIINDLTKSKKTDNLILNFHSDDFILKYLTTNENDSDLQSLKIRTLFKALNELTPRQKEVVYLRYFEDLEYSQIADLMNISVKGLYKLNYRALECMKESLTTNKNELLLLLLLCKSLFHSF